jgi:hypothetical protein
MPEQKARFESDPWEPVIANYLEGKTTVTMVQVFIGALKYEIEPPGAAAEGESSRPRGTPFNKVSMTEKLRVAAVMVNLGWQDKREPGTGRKRWVKGLL